MAGQGERAVEMGRGIVVSRGSQKRRAWICLEDQMANGKNINRPERGRVSRGGKKKHRIAKERGRKTLIRATAISLSCF